MKKFTYEDIVSWNPCYDPVKHLSKDWTGTAIDILKYDNIPFEDRLWAVLRTELVSEKLMRLFAVWSYRQTLKFIQNPDPRSLECADVAERHALGESTAEELSAAYSAAWSAYSAARSAESAAYSAARSAESAAYSAAYSSARSAARSAESAYSAAYSAARSAARSAESAYSAAYSAARSAESAYSAARPSAYSAAYSAARSAAESAAYSAARSAESAQKDKLIEMIEAENRE